MSLTVSQAARISNLSEYQIRDAISRGDLPARQAFVINTSDLIELERRALAEQS